MIEAFRAFWIALLCAAGLAYPIYLALQKLNARQTISQFVPEHAQKQGTPTMGGLIILPGLMLSLIVTPGGWPPAILVAGFALIGFLDDFVLPRTIKGSRGLSWKPKLLLEMLVACAVAYWQYRLGPDAPAWRGVIFVAFLILFFSNAYNFADGMDGLAGGLLLCIAPTALVIVLILGPEPTALAACAAMAAGILPFLLLNAPPAKVFMGDVGALPVGALLGWVFARIWFAEPPSGGCVDIAAPQALVVIVGLVLIVELVPVPLQILSVKLRKKRLFHRTPIHHSFQDKGWPETRVVALFLVAQLICSAAAISIASGYCPRVPVEPLSTGAGSR